MFARPSILAPALAVLLALACGDSGSPDAGGEHAGDESGGNDEDTGEDPPPPPPGDQCATTELALDAPTRTVLTLRNAMASEDEIGSSCGITGPVVFVRATAVDRVDLHVHATGRGFVPRVAVLLPGCASEIDAPERLLACASELPATLMDLGPDAELLLAIGVDADDPALDALVVDGLDPLEFELDLAAIDVLGEGELCGPSFGRCEGGTVCPDEAQPRCVRPPADSCVAPGELALGVGEPLSLEIAADEPHSDAHAHSCTGWRRPERVDRLILPEGLPNEVHLQISTSDPRVGLALRGASCLPADALACAPAATADNPSPLPLRWGAPGQLAALSQDPAAAPLLFVELPSTQVRAEPPLEAVTVTIEIAPDNP